MVFCSRNQRCNQFYGRRTPVPLRQAEIDRIFAQIAQTEGTERPKISFNVGEAVKIHEGPFLGLTGIIEEVDTERGKLKVSVSIFGRFTPVELEYSQVSRADADE